jgi:hypothetical protein
VIGSKLQLGCGFHASFDIFPTLVSVGWKPVYSTDMRLLSTGIPSEKRVVRLFRLCANVIECTYTNLDSIAYHTQTVLYSLLLLGYRHVQRVTVRNTIGTFNTVVLQYYFIVKVKVKESHYRP